MDQNTNIVPDEIVGSTEPVVASTEEKKEEEVTTTEAPALDAVPQEETPEQV
ncbi:MAG: hypothetical protein WC099_00145 [Candidatus Paceibacterota bacterium]